jgi:hypothetical protein
VLAFLQMVDAITGKVMSSKVIVLALKVHCNTTKNKVMWWLTILVVSTTPDSD